MRNTSQLPVEFDFRWPNETDIELEPWADKGDVTKTDIRHNFLLDQKIFQVTPKSGCIEPAQDVEIHFTYSPCSLEYGGYHDISLLMSIKNGKQVVLHLIGQTLDMDVAHIFMPDVKSVYRLQPVPIGIFLFLFVSLLS